MVHISRHRHNRSHDIASFLPPIQMLIFLIILFCIGVSIFYQSGVPYISVRVEHAVFYLGKKRLITSTPPPRTHTRTGAGTKDANSNASENQYESARTCIDKIRGKESQSRIAVAVLAANRPQYFKKVLSSLQQQTVTNFDVFLFVDHIPNNNDNQATLTMGEKFKPAGGVHVPVENYGIARLTMWAVETMFASKDRQGNNLYDRILVLEDDHLIGHNYIEAMGMLLTAADSDGMQDVAVVNGNYINTPTHGTTISKSKTESMLMIRDDDECVFQVAPLNAMTHLNSHNVWAWATTRKKWDVIHDTLKEAMHLSGLDRDNYKHRNKPLINKVMDDICDPNAGFSNWKGQDWMRACVFYSKGMKFKLQPTRRLMSYIGQDGLHMKKEVFQKAGFDPVEEADQLKVSVDQYPEDLCSKTCVLEKHLLEPSLSR
mmetsp:Transcript_6672/g.9814  ORF Transcript_6672/g.9814 Transcript_6672/m.9814 type:complete len:431 (+) Transcript_6672:59-1351(+)